MNADTERTTPPVAQAVTRPFNQGPEMILSKTLPLALPFNPVLSDYRQAFRARQVARGGDWHTNRAAADLLRESTYAASAEVGKALGAILGRDALRPSNCLPSFLHELQLLSDRHRFIDHPSAYRFPPTRGKLAARNSVVVVEPYIPAQNIPAALAIWKPELAKRGLGVVELPRDLLTHNPEDANSHPFLITSLTVL